MKMQVTFDSDRGVLEEVKQLMESRCQGELALEFAPPGDARRGLSPEVLVAMVGSASAILSVIITEVVRWAARRGTKRIIIEVGDQRIDVPSDISEERLKRVVEVVSKKNDARIIIP